MEKYSELSYRDIQARAKELGIPANKKREVLIEAICEAEKDAAVEKPATESEAIVETVPEPAVEVAEEPEAESKTTEVEVANEQDVNILDQSLEYFDSNPEGLEAEEEEFHECDTGDLIDAFEGMQLRGIPNPSGVKTVFQMDDPAFEAPKIDWGIQFEDENTENDSNLTNNLPTPCGKHTIFTSPDLQMGKGIHWHYEDFDKTAKKPSVTLNAPLSSTKTMGPITPSKNMSSEDRMQFWLAKGPKTPIR